jgi:hypothetical protein
MSRIGTEVYEQTVTEAEKECRSSPSPGLQVLLERPRLIECGVMLQVSGCPGH